MAEEKDDLEFEIEFFESIVEQNPDYHECMMALGNAYTLKGDYHRGLEIDQRLAEIRPRDKLVFYNLACSLSLLQRLDDAFDALERAIELGYLDYDYMLKDDDLANLRRDPRFPQIILSHFQE